MFRGNDTPASSTEKGRPEVRPKLLHGVIITPGRVLSRQTTARVTGARPPVPCTQGRRAGEHQNAGRCRVHITATLRETNRLGRRTAWRSHPTWAVEDN